MKNLGPLLLILGTFLFLFSLFLTYDQESRKYIRKMNVPALYYCALIIIIGWILTPDKVLNNFLAVFSGQTIVDEKDFFDNTYKYKGKTVELPLTYSLNNDYDLRTIKKLADENQNYGGYWDVVMIGENTINLNLPSNTNVPNVTFGEYLLVKFRCTEGSLDRGNEIISIARK